jgi:hypothetical protein
MPVPHELALCDAFYALVLDEIRCQPNLTGELAGNELGGVALRAFGHGPEWVCAQIEGSHTELPQPVIMGSGFNVVRSLIPPPATFSVAKPA